MLSGFAESTQYYLKWRNPVNITVLNSTDDDFAPAWNRFENMLYFNSNREGISKFYKCNFIDSTQFDNVEILKCELNETANNVSFITFFADDRAYISTFRMNITRPFFNIFETILTRNGWSAPLPLNNFISDFNTLHPTISPDGNMLVVSSDINSKQHKTDLFISYKNENGIWGDMEPMTALNTEGNEITPQFSSNDTLFLASDGQGGPGGFDLFYSTRRRNGSWTRPNPLTELNTAYDESDFTALPNNRAVFTSNRPGSKGGLDLYLTSSYLTEYKIAPERMLEISIATQIMTLRSSDEFNYEYMPLVTAVMSNASQSVLDTIFTRRQPMEQPFSINALYINTANIIGQRLYENPGSKLVIHYNILETDDKNIKLPNAENIANRAIDFFVNKWNVPRNNISLVKHLKKLSGAELSAYPMIYFDSDKPALLKYAEIGDRKIDIDPPFSDIFVKIKPAENLAAWTTTLYTNKVKTNYLRTSEKAGDQFSISLTDYADMLRDADSLTIRVAALNRFSDTITKELHFDLTHSETKKRRVRTIDGIKYEQIYLFIPEEQPSEVANYISDITRKISESAEFSKSLTVQFFSASGQKRAMAYTELLKEKMNLPYLHINIEQVPYKDELPFRRSFAPFIIRIMIEKI